ncbi:outer membrane beta-barrel protein [Prevotella sp. AGR2160]|uniref:outer membrane beta-barrel protein n=1 Tax=Prevotella sp. AGR2160 TaxID=1280674 RepID=UPI0003FD592F|nr:outer membrane beta-barrel protein [Prevotella sp. AGR2160]
MRKSLLLFLALGICTTGHAQVKHVEHNFYLGLGGVTSTPYKDDSFAFRVGYGLNCYFSDHWSFMPGVAMRARVEPGDADYNVGAYDCTYIDIPLLAQYHLRAPKESGLVVECGPVLSFVTSNNTYYVDADPSNEITTKRSIRPLMSVFSPAYTIN